MAKNKLVFLATTCGNPYIMTIIPSFKIIATSDLFSHLMANCDSEIKYGKLTRHLALVFCVQEIK